MASLTTPWQISNSLRWIRKDPFSAGQFFSKSIRHHAHTLTAQVDRVLNNVPAYCGGQKQRVGLRKLMMAKFALGDAVAKDKDHSGNVLRIFTSDDGEPRYALDHDGELQFLLESELAPLEAPALSLRS
jgi:hypothetical protein